MRRRHRGGRAYPLQAAEKLDTGGAIHKKHPSGAEARIDFAAFAARLKSRPDTELTTLGFSQPLAQRGESGLTVSDEVAP
jgi:hypothetical protein